MASGKLTMRVLMISYVEADDQTAERIQRAAVHIIEQVYAPGHLSARTATITLENGGDYEPGKPYVIQPQTQSPGLHRSGFPGVIDYRRPDPDTGRDS